ncbi:MAG: hypothetical protein Q8P59_02680 [Dehalococcoidia bacterium]|nr:hypothetical protein [Dehalococcoidia bacterium]
MEHTGNQADGIEMVQGQGSQELLQELFLSRMKELLLLSQDRTLEHWQRVLVTRAIYSTYLDCQALSIAKKARSLLREAGVRRPRSHVVRA